MQDKFDMSSDTERTLTVLNYLALVVSALWLALDGGHLRLVSLIIVLMSCVLLFRALRGRSTKKASKEVQSWFHLFGSA